MKIRQNLKIWHACKDMSRVNIYDKLPSHYLTSTPKTVSRMLEWRSAMFLQICARYSRTSSMKVSQLTLLQGAGHSSQELCSILQWTELWTEFSPSLLHPPHIGVKNTVFLGKDPSFWRATQFRQFLLYTGVLVLKDVTPSRARYIHFLKLSVNMRMLLDVELSHGLHLPEDVVNLGCSLNHINSLGEGGLV